MAVLSPGGAGGPGPVAGLVVVDVVVVDVVVVVVVVGFVLACVAAVVVVVVGDAVIIDGVELVAATGTDAAFGVEEELPQPAAASAVRTSRASRDRRRRTSQGP